MARAYVDFAIDDAALMELMFETKTAGRPGGVQEAAVALFETLDSALGPVADGEQRDEPRQTFKMLFAATMQGIASLVASGRVERPDGDRLVDAAMDTMLSSELAARAITAP